jgi:hypothetical protein
MLALRTAGLLTNIKQVGHKSWVCMQQSSVCDMAPKHLLLLCALKLVVYSVMAAAAASAAAFVADRYYYYYNSGLQQQYVLYGQDSLKVREQHVTCNRSSAATQHRIERRTAEPPSCCTMQQCCSVRHCS